MGRGNVTGNYYQHENRIIEDIEAQALLNIQFTTTKNGFDWLLNVTQMKFLRDSFDEEGVNQNKDTVSINIRRWNLTDAKKITDILENPHSIEYQLYQIAHSLHLIEAFEWPSDKEIKHVVIHGCIDRYAKARIEFIKQFQGNIYYLTNPRGLFNDEESLSKLIATFFKLPENENDIQQVLNKHKNGNDQKNWKQNLSELKNEILLAIGQKSWCEAKEGWYYHGRELYDLQAKNEGRESLQDWPVAMDMVDYYLTQHINGEKRQRITLIPVLAIGKNGRIANTEDSVLAWHEQYDKKIATHQNEKIPVVFVSDNLLHGIEYQDIIVKSTLPENLYEIITVGPAAKDFSIALATDSLTKRIYAMSASINKILASNCVENEFNEKLSITIAPNSTLYRIPKNARENTILENVSSSLVNSSFN